MTFHRPEFTPQPDVHQNIVKLREVLGDAGGRPLARDRLAEMLNARDGGRRNGSTIQRWEEGAEPDLWSVKFLADLVGCTFEEFALGPKVRTQTVEERIASYPRRKPRPFRREDFLGGDEKKSGE